MEKENIIKIGAELHKALILAALPQEEEQQDKAIVIRIERVEPGVSEPKREQAVQFISKEKGLSLLN